MPMTFKNAVDHLWAFAECDREEDGNEETHEAYDALMDDLYVVMVGDLSSGFKTYGPFLSFNAAEDWVLGEHPKVASWISTVKQV